MTAYQERSYRISCRAGGLAAFTARVKETDLWIMAERDLRAQAVEIIMALRLGLEAYIRARPEFVDALTPLADDDLAPPLVRRMLTAGRAAGVGPMAAVAGAMAQATATALQEHSQAVAVENGGDVYLDAGRDLTIGLFAGASPLSGRLGLRVAATAQPLAVSTSSGTVGHSLSLGRADAATIIAADAALADAAATALGNRVRAAADLRPALEWAAGVHGVLGALAIIGGDIAAWGQVELVEL
ncbi:ApbE family lipoprotein [Desulfarculus baarsii DSM 2075]|uniref:ApbE family lipoprotein n=1 Tax=Desulfarculus baarsii (strain ATCC 33931 / DSM 2075 / LMG 7858 / VKM B-1802 / 2st14) TaxID=644282 RepID=E1QGH1_DESB2|nr:UPF0280 family protein [Desulfarculus baarsii]ADK84664.1 ApbE family lipoprotein [Desulfarculus baarsii DSM 2075]